MSEDNRAVENGQNAAPVPGVEANVTPVAPAQPSEAEVNLATELEKVRIEKDNYRKAALQNKGKIPKDDDLELDGETQEQMFRRIAREEMMSTKGAELEAREAELTEKLIKKNRELELALANRSQMTNMSQSGSGESVEVQDNYFTPEQLAHFKKLKIDPNKVKENILKNSR